MGFLSWLGSSGRSKQSLGPGFSDTVIQLMSWMNKDYVEQLLHKYKNVKIFQLNDTYWEYDTVQGLYKACL